MKGRILTALVLLLALGLGAFFFDPGRRLRGLLNGEAFYAGRPTSYWLQVLPDEDTSAWQRLTNAGPEAVPFLIEQLKDGDDRTRERVAALLGSQGSAAKEAVPHLLAILSIEGGGIDPKTIKLMNGIDEIKKKRPGEPLKVTIEDDQQRLRYSVAEALRDIDPETAKKVGLP